MKRVRRGFTLVELIVVIAVIAILAGIVIAMYGNTQQQARDVQIRDAADKVTDAIRLFATKNSRFPKGGSGSSALAYDSTSRDCTTGSGSGSVIPGDLTCTIGNSLLNSGYLPTDFFAKLPANKEYDPAMAKNLSIITKQVDSTHMLVYYWLGDPQSSDTTRLASEIARCGEVASPSEVTTYKMKNATCIILDV